MIKTPVSHENSHSLCLLFGGIMILSCSREEVIPKIPNPDLNYFNQPIDSIVRPPAACNIFSLNRPDGYPSLMYYHIVDIFDSKDHTYNYRALGEGRAYMASVS